MQTDKNGGHSLSTMTDRGNPTWCMVRKVGKVGLVLVRLIQLQLWEAYANKAIFFWKFFTSSPEWHLATKGNSTCPSHNLLHLIASKLT